MKITEVYGANTKNKLTISAGKANVRMKFASGNSTFDNAFVKALFGLIMDEFPDEDRTYRGNAPTVRLLADKTLCMCNDSKTLHLFFAKTSDEVIARMHRDANL